MTEGNKESASSQQSTPEEKKQPQPQPQQQQPPQRQQPPSSTPDASATQPRPAAAIASTAQAAPRPVVVPAAKSAATPPVPPSRPQAPRASGRRTFLKALLAVGAVLSIIPFVPWGTFLSSSVESGSSKPVLLQKLVIDDLPQFGAAAGVQVNVNDLTTFPPNSAWIFTYPSSGDPTLDAENPNTFQKFELIRLPESLGGANKKASDFVAFSKVCVHLWCSPNYIPAAQQYQCPCHGSIYRVPDGLAIGGPASLQPAPTNAIPMATLQVDSEGNLYVFYPNLDPSTQTPTSPPKGVAGGAIEGDGTIGYGRDYLSYENFILPSAGVPAYLPDLTEAP